MQIRTGTVDIISGTNLVTAHALGPDWTPVTTGLSRFSLIGDNESDFLIQTKTPPGSSASGKWELTLAATYEGPTVANHAYCIWKDFTLRRNLPYRNPGDANVAQLWNRGMDILDLVDTAGVAGAIVPLSNLALTVTLDKPKPSVWMLKTTVDGVNVLQLWMLETGSPTGTDVATMDDAGSRWRQML